MTPAPPEPPSPPPNAPATTNRTAVAGWPPTPTAHPGDTQRPASARSVPLITSMLARLRTSQPLTSQARPSTRLHFECHYSRLASSLSALLRATRALTRSLRAAPQSTAPPALRPRRAAALPRWVRARALPASARSSLRPAIVSVSWARFPCVYLSADTRYSLFFTATTATSTGGHSSYAQRLLAPQHRATAPLRLRSTPLKAVYMWPAKTQPRANRRAVARETSPSHQPTPPP